MIAWASVGKYLYDNKISIVSWGGLLASSAVKVMPVPGTRFNLYTFVYDWTHQFLNINNTRLSPSPLMTPPSAQESINKSPNQ